MGQDLVEIHPRELQFTCKSPPASPSPLRSPGLASSADADETHEPVTPAPRLFVGGVLICFDSVFRWRSSRFFPPLRIVCMCVSRAKVYA